MSHRHSRLSLSFFIAAILVLAAPASRADLLTSAELKIEGTSLRVLNPTATVQLGTPASIQTEFGGKTNDEAPVIEGALVLGDLIGPGIAAPITISTAPGHAFQVAGLSEEGVYYLQNIRLVKSGQLLQTATPSYAVIQVTNALQTSVTVRQLTPEELRARGITVDPSNFDVYEYTFSFLVDGKTVEIPYPVIINRITHEVTPLTRESPYHLPADVAKAPPRWNPPASVPFELVDAFDDIPQPPSSDSDPDLPPRPQIHAAIVVPNSLAVLHQFFAVALVVSNGAPNGSQVTLDSITAAISAPNNVRIVKSDPAVSFGQPVSITGPGGVTFLAAQAQGQAEWTAEGLKSGTYTLNLDVQATFHSPGQKDIPLAAHPKATIVVHDARFNITFSHPETVNKGVAYTTYTFITNTSDSAQDIVLSDNNIPDCVNGAQKNYVCRVAGTPSSFNVHLEPGQTKSVQSKLMSGLTGHVFATAASIDGESSAINSASFVLDLGVSPTGVPLSPVTLVLPYYARTPYLSQDFLDAQLGLFGIGYGLATAPLNKQTAKFPRIITTDVFTRAVDLARAGERMFIGEDHRDSLATLSLDLLGNATPLAEWDQFRRQEMEDPAGDIARNASAALATELASAYAGSDGRLTDFSQRFAAATAYRTPYVLALAHGSAPSTSRAYPIQIVSNTTSGVLDVPSSAAANWKRQIPYGDAYALNATNESGELALIGRATADSDFTLTLTPTAAGSIELVFPSLDGKLLRATGTFTAGSAAIHIHIFHGAATSNEIGLATTPVDIAPIAIIAARQDLHLDADGHVVSMLFNRALSKSGDLSASFDTDVTLDAAKYGASFSGKRVVAGAALQQDGRIIRLNYDSSLSSDAQYTIRTSNLVESPSSPNVVPVTEVRNSALILGTVIAGDNKPIPNADLILNTKTGTQYQKADASGNYLFEYVPRDVENGLDGGYNLLGRASGKETRVIGAIRLLHTVHHVNVSFLGRGTARGHVRYDNGDPVPNASVVVGSTMFNQFRHTTTGADGLFEVTDVPVGPLTFSAQDVAGNIAYAANELHAGGETVVQDVSIYRRPFPGTGTVKGRVIRSDSLAPVVGAHVGVYSQGYGLTDSYTDSAGRFEFTKVPSGFVTVLGEDYSVAPQSIAVDFDLKPDTTYDTGDLVLNPRSGETMVAVEGVVTIEDPLRPGSADPVPAARVQIKGMLTLVADEHGKYAYTTVPQSFTGRDIRAYDPVSGRAIVVQLPTLVAGTNNVPIRIVKESGSGVGIVRVHLLSGSGQPVSGYHVFEPGFPTVDSIPAGDGIYEFRNVAVGRSFPIMAAPVGAQDATYGFQVTQGRGGVSYPDQIAALSLRLPGQGSVRGRILQQTQAGVFVQLAGHLKLSFLQWSDREQNMVTTSINADTNGTADAVFANMPAQQDMLLETFESEGYASASVRLFFDGDVQQKTLTLSTLASINGRVMSIDGYTPVSGATVSLVGHDLQTTGLDGSFSFRNASPNSTYTLIADYVQNGIMRKATVNVTTPVKGGPVNNVTLILLSQGSVEGKIVNDSGQVVPYAKYWLRELAFPGRYIGSQSEPLTADGAGRFSINNVFTVPVRIAAYDPINTDLYGVWNGALTMEGEVLTPTVVVGGAGKGNITISVVDPNAGYSPVANAEVSLFRNSLFDFGSTDATGTITFVDVPVGSYAASAYSKALGKVGSTTASLSVVRDQTITQQITLLYSGAVDGTLTDPQNNGSAVPGANITLFGAGYQTRATTTADGVFEFLGVREGSVDLIARDPLSIRRAVKRNILVTSANGTTHVPMTLEPTSTLTVKAFLPNDTGGNSGVLAPLVNIDVNQYAPGGRYLRTTQTNGAQFPGLVRDYVGINVGVQELGGRNRFVARNVSFAPGEAAKEINDIVFPAFGSVVVTVQQDPVQQGAPPTAVPNVFVTVSSGGVSANGYTDGNGKITLTNLPLGTVSVQASTLGARPLTGATSVSLGSQSTPAPAVITIGSYKAISGLVEAEQGGVSAGTRVFARFSNVTLETRTDVTGHYGFQGIIATTGTGVTLTYLGPDDATIGAIQGLTLTASSPDVTEVPAVKLDSTPPRLISISPGDGSTNVAPDTTIAVKFSRGMNLAQLSGGSIALYDVAANSIVQMQLIGKTLQSDGSEVETYTAKVVPVGGKWLKSNTLFRLQIAADIQDNAGHVLGATIGASFTTSDYSNPQVTAVSPSPKSPLPKNNFQLAVTFSKALDPAPWAAGGSGVMQFVQINSSGTPIGSPVPGTVRYESSVKALYFTPDALLVPQALYRLSISGAVDSEGRGLIDSTGHALSIWTQDFSSFDEQAPIIAIGAPTLLGVPIASGDPLYSGVSYNIAVTLTNPDGSAATDVKSVTFYSVDANGVSTVINHVNLKSVDITPLGGVTSFTLKVAATDQSDNQSAPVTQTWTVQPVPSLAIASTAIAPSIVYAGQPFTNTVTLGGGAISANVTVSAYVNGDNIPAATQTATVTRANFSAAWTPKVFTLALPATTPASSQIVVKTTASDVRGSVQKIDPFTLTADGNPPVLNPLSIQVVKSSTPSDPTSFHNTDQFKVHAYARDAETGIATATFTINGTTYVVTSGTWNASTQLYDFVTPTITVQARNEDLTVPISVVVADNAQNKSSGGTTVTYLGVHDPNAPKVAWLSPLHDAAWPALQGFKTKISVYATATATLNATFDIDGVSVPATRNGTQFDADITLDLSGKADQTLTITAKVDDGTHFIELPLTVDVVASTHVYPPASTTAITATNPTIGDSIVVDGGRLVLHVPVTLKNLIVINGGLVDTVNSTTITDEKIALTIADHLFVDNRSRVDVSARGYLGGLQNNFDNTDQNHSVHGVTLGRTTTNGAYYASASHAGLGGEEPGYSTNPPYGAIKSPADLGSGGGADLGTGRGGQGGGSAVVIATSGLGKVVVAGVIAADGESGLSIGGGAGSGGSIHLTAKTIVLGSASSISANGGDDSAGNPAQRGAGGGRVSIEASSLLDIDTTLGSHIAARGGRNVAGEAATAVDGGAGTIFLRYPEEANGELLIDPGFPTSLHLTRGTVIGESLTFDRLTVAPRALVRFDGDVTVGSATNDLTTMAIDPTARVALATDLPTVNVTANPAAGGTIAQNTNLSVTYNAASLSGIGRVIVTLDPSLVYRVDTFDQYNQTATATDALLVPANAVLGSTATLRVRVIDRAGRVIDAAPQTFTISQNQAPVITAFDLNAPAALYIGGTFTATVSATDDQSITTLGLTTQFGTNTPSTQTATMNTTPASKTFTVTVPLDKTLDAKTITLTALANDGYPSRTTSMVKTLTIASDTTAPAVTISQPAAGATFNEGNNNLVHIVATVTDAESGVSSVTATMEGGETITLTGSGSTRSGDIHVPSVPDGNDIPRVITVTARDVVANIGTGTVTINVHPLYDPTAPVATWNCPGDGGFYPPSYATTFTAVVVPGAGTNGTPGPAVDTVTFSDGVNTVTATASGTTFTAPWTIPNTPGLPLTITLTARSIGGATTTLVRTLNVVAVDKTISSSLTIGDGVMDYDFQNVAITAGTVTINGHHEFKKLLVLGNAVVNQIATGTLATAALDIKADTLYVACTASIDVSGAGYVTETSYPAVPVATNGGGGSHLGEGGGMALGFPYGSVYQPREVGAGGGKYSPNQYTTYNGGNGGGRIAIQGTLVQIDGNVYANGYGASGGGGAGGSIWIRTTKLAGTGKVWAVGGTGTATGGGGAIAIEYSDPASTTMNLNAQTAANSGTAGAAGTVWTKGPDSTYGSLLVDNKGVGSGYATELPSLGKGNVLTGSGNSTVVTDRSSNIPAFFAGHWIEIRTAAGTLRGRWKISAVNAKTATLQLNANETTGITAGDQWSGVYRFDAVSTAANERLYSADNILIGDQAVSTIVGTKQSGQTVVYAQPIVGDNINIVGHIAATSITATNLTIAAGGIVQHVGGGSLALNVSGTMTIAAGGSIDVSGLGYGATATYPGAAGVANNGGGSHLGEGGRMGLGATFGSVYQPQELGGGGGNNYPNSYTTYAGAPGGGRVAIQAGTLQLDGNILANGWSAGAAGGGAGGSIWLRAAKINGAGLIEAKGASGSTDSGGGGGAIAIEYSDAATSGTWQSSVSANGASSTNGGAAGTVFIKGANAVYGSLTIDNKGVGSGSATELPSLGSGNVLNGSGNATVVTDRGSDIPSYFIGHWVEVRNASGTVRGRWKIAAVAAKTITLQINANETTNITAGDRWSGVYRFDAITAVANERVYSADNILIGDQNVTTIVGTKAGGQTVVYSQPIVGDSINIVGHIAATSITAANLTIAPGGIVQHVGGGSVALNVSGTLTIAAGGSIDASGLGYGATATYPGAAGVGNNSGGSHIGEGGRMGLTASFGSVYQPQELGGGGGNNYPNSYTTYYGAPGGGRVAIQAGTLQLDGSILANGFTPGNAGGGAGGSIWLRAGKIAGAGVIEARGASGTNDSSGGGGAIAVEYSDPTTSGSWQSNINASSASSNVAGAAGTVFIKGANSVYGSLTIDNKNVSSGSATELPSLGSGSVLAGSGNATVVTDRGSDIPAYFIGNWIEIRTASGTVRGRWKIAAVAAKTITLQINANETTNIAAGDQWAGIYRFDAITAAANERFYSTDNVLIGEQNVVTLVGTKAAGQNVVYSQPIVGDVINVVGHVAATSIKATALTLSPGGILQHVSGGSLSINVSSALTIANGASIDVSGAGYGAGATYSGAAGVAANGGGSHLGQGGRMGLGAAFGSVYQPQELGGGGGNNYPNSYTTYFAAPGGGRVAIQTGVLQLDGSIVANGWSPGNAGGGAGGSIWLRASRINGDGQMQAVGASGPSDSGGGGGAIAVEYTDAASAGLWQSNLAANGASSSRAGAAGTVFIKGPNDTYGTLTIDNKGIVSSSSTEFPALGSGIAQAGSGNAVLVTDRGSDIPAYFVGHWVEISSAGGTLKGTWRIASINAKTATLAANANDAPTVQQGDKWRGVYRFDNVHAVHGETIAGSDPIRIVSAGTLDLQGPTTAGQYLDLREVTANQVNISGNVIVTSVVAPNITIKSGALVIVPNDGTNPYGLNLNASTSLTIESGATIDVSGRGYGNTISYPGAVAPYAWIGGSHIGASIVSGLVGTGWSSVFGSVYRPAEAGGGAYQGGAGGAAVRISSPQVTLNGTIKANGADGGDRTGAGGSIWITATLLRSTGGALQARGGDGKYEAAGGGAIAIEYSDATSTLPTALIRGGSSTQYLESGTGTLYVKGPAPALYGDLTVDNGGQVGDSAVLPSFGNGTAQAGSSGATLVTGRATTIPPYFIGHWIEISTGTTVKGTWRISAINDRTVTLAQNGSEVIDIQPSDKWQGVYRFDNIRTTQGGGAIASNDPIRLSDVGEAIVQGSTGSAQPLEFRSPGEGTNVSFNGNVVFPTFTAPVMTVKSGAKLTSVLNASTPATITLNAATSLTVESGASIDVSGKGYGNNVTHPSAAAPYQWVAGGHLGVPILNGSASGLTSAFGSVYRPAEAGGGAYSGSAGGGIIRINAGQLNLNGTIAANGTDNLDRTGAGGSIWITAGLVRTTGGTLEARAGDANYEPGGGGALLIEYTDATSTFPAPLLRGGTSKNYPSSFGGAGTFLAKGPNNTYGDLVIDNAGKNGIVTLLQSLGNGTALSGTGGVTLVTDRAANIPAYFVGNWVEVNDAAGSNKGTWRIATVNAKTVTLTPDGNPMNIAAGDKWRGVYRFDHVTLSNGGKLSSADGVYAGTNTAPVFTPALRSQIVVNTTPTSITVTGPAGAVTDPDLPIKLTVTSSTGTVFTANANGDGSFNIPVTGVVGTTFTIYATDSNTLPLSSPVTPVNGQVVVVNPLTSFAVQPTSIIPGGTVTITLRLTYPAQTGGVPVTLTTSSSALPLPATYTIPAGSQMATFIVTSSTNVSSSTSANLTALSSGDTKTATVTIVPDSAKLASVSVSPSSLTGGTTAIGTVTLGGVAPAGGAVVLLSSSNSAFVAVPQSVTVPPGATSATFTVNAVQTGTADVIGIFGATKSATVNVSGCGSMSPAAQPSTTSLTKTWFDDLPLSAGQTLTGGTVVSDQSASLGSSIFLSGGGLQSFTIAGASDWNVVSGDSLVVHALINPCKPPRQIQAIWKDSANVEYRASWGEDVIQATTAHTQVGPMIAAGAWVRLEALASVIGAAGKSINSLTVQIYDGEAWFDVIGRNVCSIASPVAAPALNPSEVVWFEDAPPAGAVLATPGTGIYAWSWPTTQFASGSSSHSDGVHAGGHEHYFTAATAVLTPANGDVLVTYALIDPCNPVRELMLQWNDGSGWEHRAYWGDDLLPWGTNGTVSRYRMGPLPPAGQWVRLEIPASLIGVAGVNLKGVSFDAYDGQVWFDRTGKLSRVNISLGKPATQISTLDVDYASRAVDGNTDGNWNAATTTHTATVIQPWWDVDLGAVLPIEDIQLWNRTDNGWGYRLSNYWIFVSNERITVNDVATARSLPNVYAYHYPFQCPTTLTHRIGRSGRFVRIQLNGTTEPLSLAEVQVWAPASAMKLNVAGGGVTSQSTVYTGSNGATYPSELAVNGDAVSPGNTGGSFSITLDNDPHWDVDLGSSRPISTIDVLHRLECAPNLACDQLTGYYLFVSDQPFTSTQVAPTIAQNGVGVWYHGAQQWPSVSFPVYRSGRYVRVAKPGANTVVTLSEVRVWADNTPLAPLATTAPTH